MAKGKQALLCMLAALLLSTGCASKEGPNVAEESAVDLSTPEATVRSFTKAAAAGDVEAALACFVPEAEDYGDAKRILTDPSHPFNALFASLDANAPMPVKTRQKEDFCDVLWQVTFKCEFSIQGQAFKPGDTFDFDASLKKKGDSWLIEDF